MNKQKILVEKPFKGVFESDILAEIESAKILDNSQDGPYYVTMDKFNNSGHNLFDLNSPFIDVKSASRLFKYLCEKYPSYEIKVECKGLVNPVEYNQSYIDGRIK